MIRLAAVLALAVLTGCACAGASPTAPEREPCFELPDGLVPVLPVADTVDVPWCRDGPPVDGPAPVEDG